MKTKKSRRIAIDIFAGCGGLTEGLKQAGFHVQAAIELDQYAAEVFRKNHPKVHVWQKDVRSIRGVDLLKTLNLRRGELDLLAGCPPCQGFSTLRTRNGSVRNRDSQNDLIFEFERLIHELLPKTVMMENVPALATNSRFKKFMQSLAETGYEFNFNVMNAAEFAVPQRRRRLIFLASMIGKIDFAKKARVRTVRDAFSGMPKAGTSGDALHDLQASHSPKVRRLISLIPKDGGSRTSIPRNLQLKCHLKSNGFKDVYGRMAWDSVAPTITTGCFNPSRGRFLHPVEDRAISLREAAVLQSFPRTYQFPVEFGKSRLGTMIGNALPPELIRRQAIKILNRLQKSG